MTNSSSSDILVYRKKQQESTHTKKRPAGRQLGTPRQTTSNHSRPEHAVTGSVGPSSKTSYSPMPTHAEVILADFHDIAEYLQEPAPTEP
jgi:hypothetical protein